MKDWKKELARDFIALGSIPVLILVIARIWILDNPAYLFQVIIGGVLFLLLAFLFKSNIYSGLALVMAFFLSLHYNDLKFTIFASSAYILLLASLIYLKYDKKKIFAGIVLGAICTAIGYWIVKIVF